MRIDFPLYIIDLHTSKWVRLRVAPRLTCWRDPSLHRWPSCELKLSATYPYLLRFSRSVPYAFTTIVSSSHSQDNLQRADPPYWADNWLSAATHKIAAWHWRWRKRTGWYRANPALFGSHSFLKLYSHRWCRCILMKTTCHLYGVLPELTRYFPKLFCPPSPHLMRHGAIASLCRFVTQHFETSRWRNEHRHLI